MNVYVFAVVTPRAVPSPSYSLKNLEGHGRIDVIFRCALAALRRPSNVPSSEFYAYFTKGEGYLHLTPDQYDYNLEDEISLAHKIKEKWHDLWFNCSFDHFLRRLPQTEAAVLTEKGTNIGQLKTIPHLFFLGAQQDIPVELLPKIKARYPKPIEVSLGNKPLLASQAIMLTRMYIQNKSSTQ